jgi:hypothetical protein
VLEKMKDLLLYQEEISPRLRINNVSKELAKNIFYEVVGA